jgi:hypothetical protein
MTSARAVNLSVENRAEALPAATFIRFLQDDVMKRELFFRFTKLHRELEHEILKTLDSLPGRRKLTILSCSAQRDLLQVFVVTVVAHNDLLLCL